MITDVLEKKVTLGFERELNSLSSEVKKVVKTIMQELGQGNAKQNSTSVPGPKLSTSTAGTTKSEQNIEKPIGVRPENGFIEFHWDPNYCADQVALSEGNMRCFLAESGYCFRTVIADTGIVGGIAYWEIHADCRTENELKIGVTSRRNINLNTVISPLYTVVIL